MNNSSFINALEHTDLEIAESIYKLFQASYAVEAKLLKIEKFPPLSRSISNIQSSKTQFWGYYTNSDISAIAEIELIDQTLDIHSFVVSPLFFRQGIGSKLLAALLDSQHWNNAVVETGSANKPAILLYQKFGFVQKRKWLTEIGIEKVILTLK